MRINTKLFFLSLNHSSLLRVFLILLAFFSMNGCQRDDSRFFLIDGTEKQLADYRGQWLLVNFWAEWCRPCIEEVPELNAIYAEQVERGWSLIAASYDAVSTERLRAAKQRFDIKYPMMAADPQPLVPFKRPAKLPAMVIISPEGEVFGPIYGKQTKQTVAEAIQLITAQAAK
ncbi:MAG: TlpA disulfide reductase family protein [Kangiellaceae bacterium]|jgi:peroxiredoxin|nr:TlpA disulfide reductase family protein [Kangiellaceae bacterium]